jgi:arylsulfatase A
MATCAEITGATLPENAGEDSVSMLPLLQGQTEQPTRTHLLHHSGWRGTFAIRSKDWVLIDAPSGGDAAEPDWFREQRGYHHHHHPRELFCLSTDSSEKENLYGEHPEIVEKMLRILEQAKQEAGPVTGDVSYESE